MDALMEQIDRDIPHQTTDDTALLRVARTRFTLAEEAENPQRLRQEEAMRFRGGEQWPAQVLLERAQSARPVLTVNRTNAFVNQIVNEQMQQPPGIRVAPVDSGGDIEIARIYQGLMRHIEVDSDSQTVYMTAFDHAVTHGRGFVRLYLEYESPFSFDLCLKLGRIQNPLTVYCDPGVQTLDYADMQWAFIVVSMNREVFQAEYPMVSPADMDQWGDIGDGWVQRETVRLAEYFYIERHPLDLALLADGSVQPLARVAEGVPVVQRRRTFVPIVHWCKIAGHTVLERTVWPGRFIPIIPVLGKEQLVNGRIRYDGVVEALQDPQRQYNYWASAGTEMIALAPRAPWLVTPRQIAGYERYWQTANTANHPYLLYNPSSTNGSPDPLPQRQVYEPPVQAISQYMLFSGEDMKAVTGIYDASLGARSNETSGRAITNRQQQGHTANFHFSAALATALRHIGRQLVELIPRVYSGPRTLRIIGADNEQELVQVNQPIQDAQGASTTLDITQGRYDVVIHTGPAYQTRRQETVDTMTALASAYPAMLQSAGDLLFKAMDFPGSDELARRFKKMLPPQLAEDDGKPEEHIPQLQLAVQQLQQQLQALNAYAEQQEQHKMKTDQDNARLQLQLQSKEGELALKEEELRLKEREMEVRAVLEQEKLSLEQEKLDLEVLRLRQSSANGAI
jgi:hypothetical protein